MGYSPLGHKEPNTIEQLTFSLLTGCNPRLVSRDSLVSVYGQVDRFYLFFKKYIYFIFGSAFVENSDY